MGQLSLIGQVAGTLVVVTERDETEPSRPRRPRTRRDAEAPVLPTVSRDETDIGWGDEPGARDEEWYRRERPPHHE